MLVNPSITFIIRREGEVYRLYSSVPTDFGTKPAENFIRENGIEHGYALLEETALCLYKGSGEVPIEHEIGESW